MIVDDVRSGLTSMEGMALTGIIEFSAREFDRSDNWLSQLSDRRPCRESFPVASNKEGELSGRSHFRPPGHAKECTQSNSLWNEISTDTAPGPGRH